MFKKIILAIAAAMLVPAISGCATIPGSPSDISDRTILDEKAGILAEQSYVLAVRAGELAIDAGLIKGPLAVKMASLDNQAYGALLKIRAAYQASNQTDYTLAIAEFRTIIGEIVAMIKGGP